MTQPIRVQLSRKKGWRIPENTVSVARPGKWGNPFTVAQMGTAEAAVAAYREHMNDLIEETGTIWLIPLAGKNLACWCPLLNSRGQYSPCHADVLLELANPTPIQKDPAIDLL